MAKKKPTEQPQTISKMGAIKQLLANGLSNPTEIATQAKEQFGLDIKPIYVSNVKTQMKAKAKPAKKTAKPDNLEAAVQFCEGVGGVDAAKSLLEKIERIKKL
jgi:hypothetical protein